MGGKERGRDICSIYNWLGGKWRERKKDREGEKMDGEEERERWRTKKEGLKGGKKE